MVNKPRRDHTHFREIRPEAMADVAVERYHRERSRSPRFGNPRPRSRSRSRERVHDRRPHGREGYVASRLYTVCTDSGVTCVGIVIEVLYLPPLPGENGGGREGARRATTMTGMLSPSDRGLQTSTVCSGGSSAVAIVNAITGRRQGLTYHCVLACRRRWDRERVMVMGVPEVWATSPPRPELE